MVRKWNLYWESMLINSDLLRVERLDFSWLPSLSINKKKLIANTALGLSDNNKNLSWTVFCWHWSRHSNKTTSLSTLLADVIRGNESFFSPRLLTKACFPPKPDSLFIKSEQNLWDKFGINFSGDAKSILSIFSGVVCISLGTALIGLKESCPMMAKIS